MEIKLNYHNITDTHMHTHTHTPTQTDIDRHTSYQKAPAYEVNKTKQIIAKLTPTDAPFFVPSLRASANFASYLRQIDRTDRYKSI